jgi:signal transduction histidine kinase
LASDPDASRVGECPLVLLVDDEKEILASLADQLRRRYRVITASRGPEALEILRNHDVSVVVSDQRMPDMTGAELLAKASVLQEDAVRVLLTGYSDLDAVIQAVNAGKIYFYLAKPWDPVQLQGIVDMASEQSRLMRERKSLLRELKTANAELEARVTARTAELAERNVQLEAANVAARAASQAKSVFLASMSHEIRTPMNGVLGMARLLTETPLSSEQQECVSILKESAETLLSIIDEILDFSKIEAGRLDLESLDFDLRPLLDHLHVLLAVRAAEKGLQLSFDVAPGVPGRLNGDPGRLRQILTNLIGNALKFTPKGEVSLEVRLLSEDDTSSLLRFSVRDTGVGIPDHQIGALFTPFTQGDVSTTRQFGGTGLGLSICKRLVEKMGGEIGVESEAGRGSTFSFTARLGKAGGVSGEAPALALHLAAAAVPVGTARRRVRILLAEDNLINQAVALKNFERLGYSADIASNGVEALKALRSSPYDIVFMDVEMPEMDGLQATRLIRSGAAGDGVVKIAIVAMTAHAMRGDREKFLGAGMTDYITKPIDPKVLAATIERWAPAPQPVEPP